MWALKGSGPRCDNCQEFGHIARNCPHGKGGKGRNTMGAYITKGFNQYNKGGGKGGGGKFGNGCNQQNKGGVKCGNGGF